jgi:hypothetical protein
MSYFADFDKVKGFNFIKRNVKPIAALFSIGLFIGYMFFFYENIKPEGQAIFTAGWVNGKKVGTTNSKYYVYEYVDATNTVTKGFACKCIPDSDGVPQWQGISRTGCEGPNTGNVADYPFKLTQVPYTHPVPPDHLPHGSNTTPVPNVPIPAEACCRVKPRASGLTNIFIPNDGACLP